MAQTYARGTRHRSPGTPIWARLIALVIAAALIALFWISWSDEVTALVEGRDPGGEPAREQAAAAAETNPALEACLADRVGDVDQMRDEGVIDEAQYAAFRTRAEDLCLAQNSN